MTTPEPTIRVAVEPTNPGQFFACCGLLELADRLWLPTDQRNSAEGWFEKNEFCVATGGTLAALLDAVRNAELTALDPSDIYSTPARLGPPFGLTLDWWQDERAGGKRLKPWAGTMESVGIARSMRAVLDRAEARTDRLFDYACVVPNADDPKKKKEPYYFDSRRGANALPLDIGFVQDPLGIPTLAHPAVEFFCLVGLQRCRPLQTDNPRVFDYFTWPSPCAAVVLPAAVCGLLGDLNARGYRFENAFRSGQKKHKAFNPAIPLGGPR
jgi:hypothetical protein